MAEAKAPASGSTPDADALKMNDPAVPCTA